MITRTAVFAALLAVGGAWPGAADGKSNAEATAAKGPLRLTLRLQKTTVKAGKSLWYKLELKNIGKKKIRLYDRIFSDPNAIHVNSNLQHGIYIEVIDADGESVPVKWGEYRLRYDWEGPEGTPWRLSQQETRELRALREGWEKKGMTAQQQSIAESTWYSELRGKKNAAESADTAHKRWLAPGASTATIAGSARGPGNYAGRADDDQSLREGYAQLWAIPLSSPGKYRVRAVYNYAQLKSTEKLFKEHGHRSEPEWIQFKTPFLDVEVVR